MKLDGISHLDFVDGLLFFFIVPGKKKINSLEMWISFRKIYVHFQFLVLIKDSTKLEVIEIFVLFLYQLRRTPLL